MTQAHFALTQQDAQLPRVAANASKDTVLALLRAHGAAIIENAIAPSHLARLQDELEPWYQRALTGEGEFFGRATRRFGAIFAKSAATVDLAIHPLVLEVMEGLLRGADPARPVCNSIELSATQAIGIEPGEPAQFLHRDEELWPFPHDFEVMANAMWAISDFTADNGATRIIPGSHLWARDREPLPGQALIAEAPAGSVILWLGGALHGGGANISNDIRRGLVTSYKLGWLAAQERLLVSIPPDLARRLPEKLQRLLGYQLHKPNLGWIEGRDPIEWLRGEIGEMAAATDNLTAAHKSLLADVAARPDQYLAYLS